MENVDTNQPVQLEGFASLPADTFAEGPPTGEGIAANGRTGPFAGPPVQGFSGVQFAPGGNGSTFWFLSDNGFGSKVNSPDYLLRLYQVDPNFAGSENGDGSVDIQGFVQLSDPDNLIPFEIQNGNTAERHLTGADFDIESFVIDGNGDIWVGDEFGPYILHFDATGKLLKAPIPTPNVNTLKTLNGQDPLVIGHRGASGLRPEHTLESYQLAMEQGADFVEPDLVITQDGVLIARHEPLLSEVELDANGNIKLDAVGNPILKTGTTNTTNVADKPEFADRIQVKNLDGVLKAGWWAEDFTLDEIKTLRARQSRDYRDQSFNDQFEIPTFKEVIELVQQFEADTGKKVGIYPETKHPTFFEIQGFSLEEPLIATLQATGFTDPNRIFIQSFEFQNLIELQGLLNAEGLGDIPLVQLYGDTTAAADPADPFSYPYDIRYNVEQGNDLAAIYGQAFLDAAENPLSEDTVYADLDNAAMLQIIADQYAEGAGPWKENILLRQSIDPKVDGDGDGVAEIGTQLTGEITSFIDDAHEAGLQVHPYTLRDEERFLTLNTDGTPQSAQQEFAQLIQIGADGFFTDFPETGDGVRDQVVADVVRSPDHPAVLAGEASSNLPRSRGYEGMAFSPDRMTLYPMLEGTVLGDPEGSLRIYEFDVASSAFEGLVGLYQMEAPDHAIGDFTPINEDEYLVIERDGGQAETAEFKKIFKVDLSEVNEAGFVEKKELVDLLSIADPNDLNGDGSTTFTFPFVTIEDVLVLDEDTLLVANDNNYPFSIGRGPDIDNNEIIQIKLPQPLDLDPRLGSASTTEDLPMANNHVIFIHPDGTSPSHYALARFVQKGPDGRLNWDELDHAGVYLGHMEDQLGGTSNGGAVTHATGAKVYAESFGFEQDGSEITPLSGNTGFTIVEEAIHAGKVTALVQSGAIFEPGTAAFVAETGEIEVGGRTVVPRGQTADIARQVIESGVDFILAGGEVTLLPVGADGFHGTAEEYDEIASDAIRRPSENLIELAQSLGYTVVYTRDELYALLEQPELPQKVLGVFAPVHTFNDRPEEVLAERGLPLYIETAPTIAEMLAVTQQLMEAHPNFENGSIAIVEEEGTDNFGNNNNAAGVLEGTIRADAAIGVAKDFLSRYENTLLITAADSDAGGLQVRDPLSAGEPVGTIDNNPTTEARTVPLDGVAGSNTLSFESAPDVDGDVFNFGVAWAGTPDFAGSIVAKAEGLNADKLPATVDNTGIYELMYETLFDVELESRIPDATRQAPAPTADTGNVIFIHPDGTSPSHYMAARFIDKGPDGRLNWDRMTHAGVYLGHMENQLTGTSNAGAVTHATGVKVFNESFGLEEDNSEIVPASGKVGKTILEEAIEAGKATALIQSGQMAEPGTAAFAAATTNRDGDNLRARDKYAEIIEQTIRSGADVIMGGGELYMLPIGTTGFHVTTEIDASETRLERRPEINLIELAESLGYTVVYTEAQMNEVVNGGNPPEKLLGVFAADATFNATTEENLGLNTGAPLPLYVATAPSVAEMLDAALKIVSQDPDGFFVVVEEEGTDNFGNSNNAPGTIEAVRRADDAIGVAMDFVDNVDPNTLVLTAADSDAGGLQVFQFAPYTRPSGNAVSDPALGNEETDVPFIYANPTTERGTPVFLDGATGSTGSEAFPWQSFPAIDSIDGPMGNFGLAWVGTPDFPGSIVSKAYGLNADLLPSTLDNTFIYEMMYRTLFGDEVKAPPFVTSEPAQMTGLNGYTVNPLFTIGETYGDYTPPGIPDGIGAYALNNDTVRILVNHELNSEDGYAYALANGTELTGARVSYFDIDKETLTVTDAGLAYDTIINERGEVVDEPSDLQLEGLDRFCSAQFVEAHQFGNGIGLESNIFFTGEETSGGLEYALDVETNTLYAVPWLGRAAWENLTEINTGNADEVALLVGDDRQAAPLLLYVGQKDTSAGAGFLERNGLGNGKLYAWVADDFRTTPEQFNGTGNELTGEFVEIDYYKPELAGTAYDIDGDGSIQDEFGYDALGFATQVQQDALVASVGGFKFSRPEDVATNPEDGTQVVMASTGRGGVFPSDNWGTTYLIDVDFRGDNITANLDILYDGDDAGNGQFAGPDFGLRSPDNLDWADDGYIYIQEDRSTAPSELFGGSSGEEASIWKLDPDSGQLTRVAQIDRSAVPEGQTDPNPDDIGNWESSGILDVSGLFDQAPGSLFLFDVQAHSLEDGVIAEKNLVEGGQIAFLTLPATPETLTVGNFEIGFDAARITDTASGLYVADTLGDSDLILFDITQPEDVKLDLTLGGVLEVDRADLLIAPELATALEDEGLTGVDIGDVRLDYDVSLSLEKLALQVDAGITSVSLDTALLESAAGLKLSGAADTVQPADGFQVGFPVNPEETFFLLGLSGVSGVIAHTGSVTFEVV
jgi:glycerophosphoryl diester phosphodiesterase